MRRMVGVGACRRRLHDGPVAQLVEQRTENPCVGGSIPPLATNNYKGLALFANAFLFPIVAKS